MKLRILVATPFTLSLLACVGGATLGENEAGGDGWLDHESPRTEATDLQGDGACAWTGNPYVGVSTERAYALLSETDDGDCADILESGAYTIDRKTVWGLRPGEVDPTLLLDVTGHEDVRLLDTAPGLLMMGETEGAEALYVLDHDTLDVLAERQVDAAYWGTRTAPSRNYVVVADNVHEDLPLTVIDPSTLDTASVLDIEGWGEAMWASNRDRLAAISWSDLAVDQAVLTVWDFDQSTLVQLETPDAADRTATMPEPLLQVTVDALPVFWMAFTWIGWHPEGDQVVFPVTDTGADHALMILDVPTGEVRTVPDASGPTSYTPDGSTLVAWDPDRDTELLLIDPVTLEVERMPLTLEGTPSWFVSHDGNQVVVADAFGGDALQIIDIDTGASVTLETQLPLQTMTSRDGHDEVYTMHDGLWRIDLDDAAAERVALDWTPEHVVWMPESDLLYLDDALRPRMVFWDPTLQTTLQSADLPGEGSPVAMRDLSRPAVRKLVGERSVLADVR